MVLWRLIRIKLRRERRKGWIHRVLMAFLRHALSKCNGVGIIESNRESSST